MVLAATIGVYLWRIFLVYVVGTATVASLVAVLQEKKLWKPRSLPSLSVVAHFRVFLFNIVWMLLCFIGCFLICCKWVLTFGTSDIQQDAHTLVERKAAILTIHILIGNVKVVGMENLPPDNNQQTPAPIYIANHASQIDAGVVYFLKRRFKWISKKSVIYLPGVGATMYLADHVFIDRVKGKNKKSVATLFEKSNAAVQAGIPMFFFPQGTRAMAERRPFKDGAFIVAQTNKSPLIPVSVDIPLNAWNNWLPMSRNVLPEVVLTVHKPIEVTGEEDREALKKKCFDQIYSCLPPKWENEDSDRTAKKDK